jgi:hypothetical protein
MKRETPSEEKGKSKRASDRPRGRRATKGAPANSEQVDEAKEKKSPLFAIIAAVITATATLIAAVIPGFFPEWRHLRETPPSSVVTHSPKNNTDGNSMALPPVSPPNQASANETTSTPKETASASRESPDAQSAGAPTHSYTVEFTEVPRFTEAPNPDDMGTVRGRVSGEHPERYKVVIYALTDHWYIQPDRDAYLTDIKEDGTWTTVIRLGQQYGVAVVVPSQFEPEKEASSLPPVGGAVLTKAVVPREGDSSR